MGKTLKKKFIVKFRENIQNRIIKAVRNLPRQVVVNIFKQLEQFKIDN